ncbi:MAG: DUF998 domain-containing protein [Candidatus Helarchaeota archaeon]
MKFIESKRVLKILALFGIVIPILDVVVFYILGIFTPNYNPLTKTISELGEAGAPNAVVASIYFIISGIIFILFSIGLYHGINESKGSWLGPFLLAMEGGFDFIGSGVFPCDVGCVGQTFSGMMHLIVSLIGMLAIALAPFAIWRGLKKDENWIGYEKFSLIIGILIVVMIGIFMISFVTHILVGLTQRILYYSYLAWILVMSIKLFRVFDSI